MEEKAKEEAEKAAEKKLLEYAHKRTTDNITKGFAILKKNEKKNLFEIITQTRIKKGEIIQVIDEDNEYYFKTKIKSWSFESFYKIGDTVGEVNSVIELGEISDEIKKTEDNKSATEKLKELKRKDKEEREKIEKKNSEKEIEEFRKETKQEYPFQGVAKLMFNKKKTKGKIITTIDFFCLKSIGKGKFFEIFNGEVGYEESKKQQKILYYEAKMNVEPGNLLKYGKSLKDLESKQEKFNKDIAKQKNTEKENVRKEEKIKNEKNTFKELLEDYDSEKYPPVILKLDNKSDKDLNYNLMGTKISNGISPKNFEDNFWVSGYIMGEDGNLIGKKGEDGELIGKKVYTLQFNKDKKNKVTIFKNQMEITNINMVELVEMDKINKKKILELKKKEDERQKNIKQLKEEYLKRPIDEWVNEFKDKDYYVDMIKGNKNINWNLKFEKIKIPKLPQRKSGKEIIYLKNLNQVLTSDYLMENFDGTDDIFICTEDANKRSRGWTEEGIKNIEELKELVKKAGELMDAKSKERIKQLKKEKDNTEKFDKLFEIVKLKDKIDKIQDILGDLDVKNITPKIENDNIILKITVIKKKDLFSISFDEKTPLYFNYDMSKMKNLFKKKFSKSSFKTNEMKLIISNNFNDKMYLVNRLKKIHENVINNLFEIYEKEEKDKELFGDDFVIFDDEDNKKTYPVIFKYDEGQRKVIHKKDMIYLKEKKIYYCPKDKLKDLEEEKQKKIIEEEKKNYEDAENIKEWKLFNINDILNKDKDIHHIAPEPP